MSASSQAMSSTIRCKALAARSTSTRRLVRACWSLHSGTPSGRSSCRCVVIENGSHVTHTRHYFTATSFCVHIMLPSAMVLGQELLPPPSGFARPALPRGR
jgi:hypothetical protein